MLYEIMDWHRIISSTAYCRKPYFHIKYFKQLQMSEQFIFEEFVYIPSFERKYFFFKGVHFPVNPSHTHTLIISKRNLIKFFCFGKFAWSESKSISCEREFFPLYSLMTFLSLSIRVRQHKCNMSAWAFTVVIKQMEWYLDYLLGTIKLWLVKCFLYALVILPCCRTLFHAWYSKLSACFTL